MSKCPKEGEPNTHKHEYKISIDYTIQKYLPANEWRGLTGDNIPARTAQFDKKKRDKQSIFSKYTKSSGGLKVGQTVMYINIKRPEHHKKLATITKVNKPPKKDEVYRKFLEGELKTYIEPPKFKPAYTIRFLDRYSADELKVGDEVKRVLEVKALKKLKLQSTVNYTLCLPMKAEKMSDVNLRKKLTDIVKRGFPNDMKFKPDVIKSKFKSSQSLPSIEDVLNNTKYGEKEQKIIIKRMKSLRMNLDKDDLVPTDDNDHFKVIGVSLVEWQLDKDQPMIRLKIKLKITPDGKGAKVWVQNFFDGFDCEGHRDELSREITKLIPRQLGEGDEDERQKKKKNKMLEDIKKKKIMDDYKKYRKGPKGLSRLQAMVRGRQTRRNLGGGGGRRTRKRRGGEKCPKVDITQFKRFAEDEKIQHIKEIRKKCQDDKECEWTDDGGKSHDCRELNCSADRKHTGKNGENCKPKGKCIFDWKTKKCAKFGDLKQDDFRFNLNSIRAALHEAINSKRENRKKQEEIARLKKMEAEYQAIMINRDHDLEVSHGNFYRNSSGQLVPATPLIKRQESRMRRKKNPRQITPRAFPSLVDDIENPEEDVIMGQIGTPSLRRSETFETMTPPDSPPRSPPTTPKKTSSDTSMPSAPKKRGTKRKRYTRGGKNRKKKTRKKKRRKSRRRRYTKKRPKYKRKRTRRHRKYRK